MDPADILQSVLSVMQSGAAGALPSPTAATNASAPVPASGTAGTVDASLMSLPQILMLLLSTAAVRDWMKLLLIGAVLEGCRRSLTAGWERINDYFWVTASFEWDGDAVDWLMYWLQQRKVFHSARSIEVSNYWFGLEDAQTDDLGDTETGEDRVAFLPSLSRTYSLWYKRRYVSVTRSRVNDGTLRYRPKDMLELKVLTRDATIVRDLLMEARKMYKHASQHLINVYVAESSDRWKRVATQEKRPTSSVILDPGVLELVLEDARDFLGSKKWYADRGIPFRRGYLLYGAPGAGKTSMIHSIAGELGLDIYILSLTVMALDDNSLKSLIAHLPKACIVLIEDIDAAFTRGMKRDIVDPEVQVHANAEGAPTPVASAAGKEGGAKDMMFNAVTLSGLLNALDGIAAQEGRILFATTNDYGALDPALLRPGRLDLHIEFQLASAYQATQLFRRFYTSSSPDGQTASDGDKEGDDEKPAQDSDSGYASRASSTPTAAAEDEKASAFPESVSSVYVGMSHTTRAVELSPKEVEALAARFAALVPARAFSMATLQGYLMAYKVRPYAAVEDVQGWVEKKLREKAAKEAAVAVKGA